MVLSLFDSVMSFFFLSFFDSLQSVNFNHKILLLLFVNNVGFDHLLLIELLVSDGNYFSIHDHFVEIFDIISVFISHVIGSCENHFSFFSLLLLLFIFWNIFLLLLSNSKHSLFFGNSSGKLFLFLFFINSFLLKLFFLCQDNSLISHSL